LQSPDPDASTAVIADSIVAASATVRVIGPAVSCEAEIGMTPLRDINPTVGFIPTIPQIDDGHTMDPSVSVPTPIAAKFDAIAAPVPDDEPHGFRSRMYGFFVWPPRPDQPLVAVVERKFAHSLRIRFCKNYCGLHAEVARRETHHAAEPERPSTRGFRPSSSFCRPCRCCL
jgi:hypothetical protein